MPRRVYTYPATLQIEGHNIIATIGAVIFAFGFLAFIVNVLVSARKGSPAGRNPWDADSLEWSVESPPPIFSFFKPPLVQSRHPLWHRAEPEPAASERARNALAGGPDWRATLCTDVLNAQPESIQWLPGASYKPFIAALGVLIGFLGLLLKAFSLAAFGAIFTAGVLVLWLWPDEKILKRIRDSRIEEKAGLPVFTTGSHATAWWGMAGLIAMLATAFGAMFFSYFYIRLYSAAWPQDGIAPPDFLFALIPHGLLVLSAVPQFWARRSFDSRRKNPARAGHLAVFGLGAVFLALQGWELSRLEFSHQANAYASLFYVTSCLLMLIVGVALAINLAAQVRIKRDFEDRQGYTKLLVQITGLFWYFTALAGALVYATLYLSPYAGW
jgi:cytochrome c oxidase subunit I+III